MPGIRTPFCQYFSLARTKSISLGLVSVGVGSLPTDPIGTTTVTFSGVNAGSEIRVYLPDGTEAAGIETCEANEVLSWSVYAPGSPNNTVSITILLRGYRWQEFSFVSIVGSQTIPIFQIIDLGWTP